MPQKTCGPAHLLEFLGIILDTQYFTISVPKEKMDHIITIIACFISSLNKTKQDVLSLLGHPPRQIVHSVQDTVLLDEQCLKDLDMWRLFHFGVLRCSEFMTPSTNFNPQIHPHDGRQL